jgi:hypothetical protein
MHNYIFKNHLNHYFLNQKLKHTISYVTGRRKQMSCNNSLSYGKNALVPYFYWLHVCSYELHFFSSID